MPGCRLGLSREGSPSLVLVGVPGLIDRLVCIVPGCRLGLSREGLLLVTIPGLIDRLACVVPG